MKNKKQFEWKQPRMCDSCPFADVGDGAALRESLGVKRWKSIVESLLGGAPFWCHETSKATQQRVTNLYCAGALAFQQRNKIETDYMKMCRGFEGVGESKATIFKRLKAITKGRVNAKTTQHSTRRQRDSD